MFISKHVISSYCCLLSFALLHHVVGFEVLSGTCFKLTFRANSPFEANLNMLISSMSNHTPPLGYWRDSIGEGINTVHGMALCRGDLNEDDCRTCINAAGGELRKRCTFTRGGIIWYDTCMLKYSGGRKFFSRIDLKHRFHACSPTDVNYPRALRQQKRTLFRWLIKEAFNSAKLYATGDVKVALGSPIYGLAQCSRDLSPRYCRKCLRKSQRFLRRKCRKKAGGMFFTGSCIIGYDPNPFATPT